MFAEFSGKLLADFGKLLSANFCLKSDFA